MTGDCGNCLLLDIGGTHTRSAVISEKRPDVLAARQRWSTVYDYRSFIAKLDDLRKAGTDTYAKVCVSFGVGLENGVVVGASKMPDFIGRRLGDDLRELFECESFIAHDCICGLLSVVGRRPVTDALGYVTISTGIGAGIAFGNGEIDVFQRVRLGHHVLCVKGELCQCGRRGCLSAYVDGQAIAARCGLQLHEITDRNFWLDYSEWLSVGLANLAKMHGLKRIFVGGGVMKNTFLRHSLPALFAAALGGDGYGGCALEYLENSEDAPLLGAAYLARHRRSVIRG